MDLLRLGLLGSNALLSSPSGLLVLVPPSLGLVSQLLGPQGLSLLLVDIFHQDTLVFEHITLALDVELVVKMAVNLLVFAIFLEQPPEHAHAAHPQLLDRHAGVGSTLAFAWSGVAPLSSGESIFPGPSPGVNGLRLLDDETILDQTTDVLSRVSIGDLVDLVGVHPYFVPAAVKDTGGQSLLQPERRHSCFSGLKIIS